jgi:hypothetical protein
MEEGYYLQVRYFDGPMAESGWQMGAGSWKGPIEKEYADILMNEFNNTYLNTRYRVVRILVVEE